MFIITSQNITKCFSRLNFLFTLYNLTFLESIIGVHNYNLNLQCVRENDIKMHCVISHIKLERFR